MAFAGRPWGSWRRDQSTDCLLSVYCGMHACDFIAKGNIFGDRMMRWEYFGNILADLRGLEDRTDDEVSFYGYQG